MKKLLNGALLLAGLACGAAQAAERLTIGVSVSDLGNAFFARIAEGVERRARELTDGAVEVVVVSSAYDIDRQIAQIEQFLTRRTDLIILAAASEERIAGAVGQARQAGVPVVAVDVNARGADVTVTTDNLQAGRIACRYLAEQLGGQGDVVVINGPSVSSIRERVAGCLAVLADFPQIRVLSSDENGGGSPEGGLEVMTYLLTAHPELDGVFAINDPSAVGAEAAARQAGREDILIVGVDGAPMAIERLQSADTLLKATAAQFPALMAETSVELGLKLVRGETLEQSRVLIPPALVTQDNLDRYRGW